MSIEVHLKSMHRHHERDSQLLASFPHLVLDGIEQARCDISSFVVGSPGLQAQDGAGKIVQKRGRRATGKELGCVVPVLTWYLCIQGMKIANTLDTRSTLIASHRPTKRHRRRILFRVGTPRPSRKFPAANGLLRFVDCVTTQLS